jgi:hypothetical protein
MSETQVTPFGNRVGILADLWLGYRFDEEFDDFVSYNDLGLPLAFALDNKIIDENPKTIAFINETWDLFMASLEIEDTGFDSLEQLLTLALDE